MEGQGDPGADPLYRRVADGILAGISNGLYLPGANLPSESVIADQYGVSRGTVRQAFAALRAEGVVMSRQGARRVVVGGPRRQGFAELRSFTLWARSLGATPSGRVVSLERRPGTEQECQELALAHRSPVWFLLRVRLLDGGPVMVERTAYPDRIGAVITVEAAESGSLTEQLEQQGITFAHADHTIDALAAGARDAQLLEVAPGAPLLRTRRRSTDPSGQPLEWSDDRYVAGAVAFTVRNSTAVNPVGRVGVS